MATIFPPILVENLKSVYSMSKVDTYFSSIMQKIGNPKDITQLYHETATAKKRFNNCDFTWAKVINMPK